VESEVITCFAVRFVRPNTMSVSSAPCSFPLSAASSVQSGQPV